jgi:hypothetical protein
MRLKSVHRIGKCWCAGSVADVRFGSKADIRSAQAHVCFTPEGCDFPKILKLYLLVANPLSSQN